MTTQDLIITINGMNDPAVIAGTAISNVAEDDVLAVSGKLLLMLTMAKGPNAGLAGTYGHFTFHEATGAIKAGLMR